MQPILRYGVYKADYKLQKHEKSKYSPKKSSEPVPQNVFSICFNMV